MTQVINGKKMSWGLLVTSAALCLFLMFLTVTIGLIRAASTPCSSSRARRETEIVLGPDKPELCPQKQGFLAGNPCRGECGGTQGCRTTDSSGCSKKCSENPNCGVWTFRPPQNLCLLRRRDGIIFGSSDSDVWGFPCRSTLWTTGAPRLVKALKA